MDKLQIKLKSPQALDQIQDQAQHSEYFKKLLIIRNKKEEGTYSQSLFILYFKHSEDRILKDPL